MILEELCKINVSRFRLFMDELYYPPGFEKQNKVFCLSIGQNKRRMHKMVEQTFFGKLYQIINQLAYSYQMEHLRDYIHNVENAVVYKVEWYLQRFKRKNRRLDWFER